jgi:hypothetical protein
MNSTGETPSVVIPYKTIIHPKKVIIAISRVLIGYLQSQRSNKRSKVGTGPLTSTTVMEIRAKCQFPTSKPKREKQTLTKQRKLNSETKSAIKSQYI